MKLIFHPEASEEMMESARFYEERTPGLGADFLDAVQKTTHRIQSFPNAGQLESANIRRRFVPGFPFKILYEDRADISSSAP